MTIPPFRIFKLPVCGVVNVAIKFRVGEDSLDHLARVVEPNFVFRSFPLWQVSGFGQWFIVTQRKAFPWNVPEWNGINLSEKIHMVGYGWWNMMRDQGSCPEFK